MLEMILPETPRQREEQRHQELLEQQQERREMESQAMENKMENSWCQLFLLVYIYNIL